MATTVTGAATETLARGLRLHGSVEEALNAPGQMQTREEMRRVRPTKTKITKVENFTLEELAKKLLSLLKEYQAHRIPQGPIIGANKAWRRTRLSFRASGN
ncbi:MAG: hypothetical protein QXE01_07300 [Sulfolobales archaeon]